MHSLHIAGLLVTIILLRFPCEFSYIKPACIDILICIA